MQFAELAGVIALFEPSQPEAFAHAIAPLSLREQRLVVAAANFQVIATDAPQLHLALHRGGEGLGPRTTSPARTRRDDFSTTAVFAEVDVASLVSSHGAGDLVAHGDVLLTSDSDALAPPALPMSPYWRLRQLLERRYPLQFDWLRQLALARKEKNLHSSPIPRRELNEAERRLSPLHAQDSPQAVLIGMHWLDLGGAERWAFETVKLTREAGFLPVVITDRASHHQWIDRPELKGALVIPLTFPLDEASPDVFLKRLLSLFSVRGVVIHHCAWLYDRLPMIRQWVPDATVVDSLHIVEYAGGGYPASGSHLDPFIDIHHVISPQLVDWLVTTQRMSRDKIALAPLAGLTTRSESQQFVERDPAEPFRIGFVGRFVRQKRPYLFLKLVRKLHEAGLSVRAVLHGSGELDDFIQRHVHADGLTRIVEIRDHEASVAQTLRDIDLLVISSQNEGITLTSFEALASGVPVLSADVGSQSTVIQEEMLVPRTPHEFVEEAARRIRTLARDESARRSAWQEQVQLAREFSAQDSAGEWMKRTLETWKK